MVVDAEDIRFIVKNMRQQGVPAGSSDYRWVTDYDFWTTFCFAYKGMERAFQDLGLRRDRTPIASNRESRNTSMSNLSRRSSGNESSGSGRR